MLLEEKYNLELTKIGIEYELKTQLKPKKDEASKRTIQDKIMERLLTEIHGAYISIEMAICSKELFEAKSQSTKCDGEA